MKEAPKIARPALTEMRTVQPAVDLKTPAPERELPLLPSKQAAPKSLHLRLEKRDVDPTQLLVGFRNVLDVLVRLAQELLFEVDQVRIHRAPVGDVVGGVVRPVFAVQQPAEVDDPLGEMGRFHCRP